MQGRYAKLEFDHTRNLWIHFRQASGGDNDANELDYETSFATLVEQVRSFFNWPIFIFFLTRGTGECNDALLKPRSQSCDF
jgi:hypothetical protein